MIKINKFIQSLQHAARGLIYLLIDEQNFRIHILAAIVALGLAIYLPVSYFELLILLLTISFVFMAEIVNTVIEKILDLLHPEFHQKIKIIKDATAGVVLFAAIVAVMIGFFIFIPKIIL
jgi:diacylglycerol kinase (ATP)